MKPDQSRRALILTGVAALAVPGHGFAKTPSTRHGFNDRGVNWHLYRDALAAAGASGRPILMVVHATWCGPCRTYRKVFFDAAVERRLEGYACALVDADAEPKVSAKFAPDGQYTPRTMVLDPEGRVLREVQGPYRQNRYLLPYDEPRALLRFLDRGLEAVRDAPGRSPGPKRLKPGSRKGNRWQSVDT